MNKPILCVILAAASVGGIAAQSQTGGSYVAPQCTTARTMNCTPVVNAFGYFPVIPVAGQLTYYWTPTASSPTAAYYQATSAPYASLTSLTFAGVASSQKLATFATNAGVPGLTFVPAGSWGCHIHAYKEGGSTTTLYCVIQEVDASENIIATVGTTESTSPLVSAETEYTLDYVDGDVYLPASTTSRFIVQVWASTVASPTIIVNVGGEADAHTFLPSNTVDATSFVPYTGATTDLNLGMHKLMTLLPTSCSGMPSGTLWNNSGTPAICP